jgi:hypothetical protein
MPGTGPFPVKDSRNPSEEEKQIATKRIELWCSQYEATSNPLYLWRALLDSRRAKLPPSTVVWEYLERVAERLWGLSVSPETFPKDFAANFLKTFSTEIRRRGSTFRKRLASQSLGFTRAEMDAFIEGQATPILAIIVQKIMEIPDWRERIRFSYELAGQNSKVIIRNFTEYANRLPVMLEFKEHGKTGSGNVVTHFSNVIDDASLATEIYFSLRDDVTLESVYADLADKFNMSTGTLERIWSANKHLFPPKKQLPA